MVFAVVRRQRQSLRWLVGMVVAGSTVAAGALLVDAAVVPNPVTDIRVTPTNPVVGTPIRTEMDFCVPDATAAGDTFAVQLPAQFDRLPAQFQLLDPDGLLVAVAAIAGNPPVATFTFTDYVDSRNDVCGNAFFESRLDNNVNVGGNETITFTINGNVTIDRVLTPRAPGVGPGRTVAQKGAFFNDDTDQCRNVALNCISWTIASRVGPFDEVIIDDVQATGATFDCTTLKTRLKRVDAAGRITGTAFLDPADLDETCTAGSIRVVVSDVPANRLVQITAEATPSAVDPQGGTLFTNAAVVTHMNPDGTVDEDDVIGRRRSAQAGGQAGGVSAPTTTIPTTTVPPTTAPPTTAPPTTAPPTTAPPTTAPPTTTPATTSPTTTVPGATTTVADTTTTTLVASGAVTTTTVTPTTNTVDVNQPLPETGSGSSLPIVSFALLTLLAGGVLVVAAARRRQIT